LSAHSYHITGRDLLIRINNEGPTAFDELFNHFYAPLCVFADRYVADEETARDIIADLFLSIWKDRATLADVDDVPAYLYTAARNKSLNYLKRARMLKKHEVNLQKQILETEQITIDQSIYEAETIRLLYGAIEFLPSECKQVVHMSLQGLSTTEIANKLRITAGAVSNQKARAIRLLKFKIPIMLVGALDAIMYCR
jgi:RNA polymerase sigma-70 factor (ECF subfamily)